MFLIKSNLNKNILSVVKDIDNICNFDYLDLKKFNTLELTEINPKSSNWVIGEPIVFNESLGIVLLEYSNDVLDWFKQNSLILVNYGVSKESLELFCVESAEKLFCLDTF